MRPPPVILAAGHVWPNQYIGLPAELTRRSGRSHATASSAAAATPNATVWETAVHLRMVIASRLLVSRNSSCSREKSKPDATTRDRFARERARHTRARRIVFGRPQPAAPPKCACTGHGQIMGALLATVER